MDPLYIIIQSGLETLSNLIILFKYADVTDLLVPEKTNIDISAEFDNTLKWVKDNHVTVNVDKIK